MRNNKCPKIRRLKIQNNIKKAMESRGHTFIVLGDKPPVIERVIVRKEETLEDVFDECFIPKKSKKKGK